MNPLVPVKMSRRGPSRPLATPSPSPEDPGSGLSLEPAYHRFEQLWGNVDPAQPLPDATHQDYLEAEFGSALEALGQVCLDLTALARREAPVHVLVQAADDLHAGRAIEEPNHARQTAART